ncbi:MAG TPA: GAF domain-containing sensor histidine kinase [Pyrinomonadaceae bacterium]
MKHFVVPTLKSRLVSVALSLAVSAFAFALWSSGALVLIGGMFLLSGDAAPAIAPQWWVAALLIGAAGACAGFLVEIVGARRTSLLLACALALMCAASYLASYFLNIDIAFAPAALATLGAFLAVQAWRLWIVDVALSGSVRRVASRSSALEGREARARMQSGLRLLATVLPLDEAVVCCLDEDGRPTPAAYMRPDAGGAATAASNRNTAWREGIRLCERAIRSGQMVVQPQTQATGNDSDAHAHRDDAHTTTSVVVPLRHEGRAVGALLIRLRGGFDETDRPLLANVAAQLARDLQRDEARAHSVGAPSETFYSVRAAERRLESFGMLSGLLTEQRFAAHALSESHDGHAVAYLDGTIAYVNAPMREAARMAEGDCDTLDLFGLLDRFRAGVFDEPSIAVRRVLQSGSAYECELPFSERGQTLSLRIALVTDAGEDGSPAARPLCLAVTVRDVTEMKEYEKLKSDMVSLMSHELRTPITSINGFAELLATDDTLPESAREFLGIIHSESQRLVRMINTFLSVTKLEQKDRQEVLKIPLMLSDVVRETVLCMQPVAKRKRIRLVGSDGSGKLPPVAADRALVTQAVMNIVDNAIRYSPERTTVTLTTALESEAVRVTVEDCGYGIPPDAVDRVWEKFYRVVRDGQDKEEDSAGLGLSFVREVVEQHGGRVGLESEVGRGSKFSFTLPRL